LMLSCLGAIDWGIGLLGAGWGGDAGVYT
jgi:hypothetical protein